MNFFNLILLATIFPSSLVVVSQQLSNHPVVLVVSFDGFRYDYLDKTDAPNLRDLRRQGVHVPYMTAQFPTNTFPNHQSIATGLQPGNHGVTDNYFWDPLLGKNLSGYDDDWEFWNYSPDVLPFYIRNEEAGDERYSGCYMWPGSSTPYGANNEKRPTYYVAYNDSIPWLERVDTVIEWITHPTKPANMLFLYFHEPDAAGHNYGTDDSRTIEVIKQSDQRAGELFQKLKEAEIYDLINIVIVSDHGMLTVTRDKVINTTGIIDRNLYDVFGYTPVFHLRPKNENDTDRIYDAFKNASYTNRFSVHRKQELTHLNYSENRRIMPILLLADLGFAFQEDTNPDPNYGVHGYDPSIRNMSPVFIAAGPLFKKGYVSQLPVNNIDLVPLFAKIMNVMDVPTDGTVERVELFLENSVGRGTSIRGLILIVVVFVVNVVSYLAR